MVSEAVGSDIGVVRLVIKRVLAIAVKGAEGPKSAVGH